MIVDYLISEIGSTTTVVTAINTSGEASIVGQGKSYTTVLEGDVLQGVKMAVKDLENHMGETLTWKRMLSTSSAAGGLKITVHGLVEEMTVKAAREAALGAGGNIKLVTAGKLTKIDIKRIISLNPNLIMIAGGTDFGERETALFNTCLLSKEIKNKPFIYCGNIANQDEIKDILQGREYYMVDNVYPRVDELNVEPARKVIQDAFENNITKAPGMNRIKDMVDGLVMPTPGAVMESAKLLYEVLGDILVFDVGGATTDIHSVTEGSTEIQDILITPEPKAKRTVEGDLGVFINSSNIIRLLDERDLSGLTKEYIQANIKAIPVTDAEKMCSLILTRKAVEVGLSRHAGYIKRTYGSSKQNIAYGKDLSKVKFIIGTGGALSKLPNTKEILNTIRQTKEDITMLPKGEAKVLLDNDYIMACAGILSTENRNAAIKLLRKSLGI